MRSKVMLGSVLVLVRGEPCFAMGLEENVLGVPTLTCDSLGVVAESFLVVGSVLL